MSAIAIALSRRKRRKRRRPTVINYITMFFFVFFTWRSLEARDGIDLAIESLTTWYFWGRTPIMNYYLAKVLGQVPDRELTDFRGTIRIVKDWLIGVDE